MTYDIIMFR